MPLPTLADLKLELNIASTGNDAELTDKLDAAVEVVSGIVGDITARTVTETHHNVASRVLLLRSTPVQSVTSVSARSYFGQPFVAQAASDYELNADAGTLYGYWFGGDVTVTYTVGRGEVPASISQAVLIIAAHLWETQRGAAPAGPLAVDELGSVPGLGFAIPNRAIELLAPYRRPAIA